ncbi:FAD-binding protein [Arsenicitalea aurantiaca]|uniref:FAD-binding protein n=1 Tax=Arsenicitalea aurantiaca TaxID=1783274 RepID=A0A433X460_9HYPH|nr:FAD-binding protein [Arsenicitalea aurantiaca]RUT28842.1 FAD-binding protein [Arsenicitalea aurantiaca]
MSVLFPKDEAECAGLVGDIAGRGETLEIVGGGTRAGLGRPVEATHRLSSAQMSGITLYEPSELVIGARAGTPVSTIEAALAEKGQMLPFEPMDHRTLYGQTGEPTIGAVAAANVSGPRRISVGAARDHLIGVRFVNGRGEVVKSGGRVMKNVTGLDLVKLSAGAHGTLGVLTEVIFKLLPRPDASLTLVFRGLGDADAVGLMSLALGSPYEVSAAAHLPAEADFSGRTLIRIEGFPASLAYRRDQLVARLAAHGAAEALEGEAEGALWARVRDCAPLAGDGTGEVWRVSVAPAKAAGFVAGLSEAGIVRHFYDWGGGLVWLSRAAGALDDGAIFAAAARAGGHAMLVRAPDARRRAGPVFQPLSAGVMALTAGIKASIDPGHAINPGRMYEGL